MFARLPDEVIAATLDELLSWEEDRASDVDAALYANVRLLLNVALVDRRMARSALPLMRERFAIGPANEVDGLRRLAGDAGTVVRVLAARDLSDASDERLATQLQHLVLRVLSWSFGGHDRSFSVALPASLRTLSLMDMGDRSLEVSFVREPRALTCAFLAACFSILSAPFRRVRELLVVAAAAEDVRRVSTIIAAATNVRHLGIISTTAESVVDAIGDHFTDYHPSLRTFLFAVTLAPEHGFADVLRRLPWLDDLVFRVVSDQHVTQLDGLARFVDTLRAAWSLPASAANRVGRFSALEIARTGPCGATCPAPALEAELTDLCAKRSPAVALSLS